MKGRAGNPGTKGEMGVSGIAGADGQPGQPGQPGTDGQSITGPAVSITFTILLKDGCTHDEYINTTSKGDSRCESHSQY